jgi:uncharacterized membrane protein
LSGAFIIEPKLSSDDMEKETGRLEAFSDGVFAIAITLLAFDLLKVPEAPAGQVFSAADLAHALAGNGPIYAVFLISFITIFIMWINHHSTLKMVRKTDGVFMFANGLLLLGVTVVPFPTAMLAEYLMTPAAATAAAVYAGLFIVISISYALLWWSAAYRRPLIAPDVSPVFRRRRMLANMTGLPVYTLALIVAFWSPLLSVVLSGGLWVFWVITSFKL